MSKFEIMEQRDEEQILAEVKGIIIEEMFYSFPLDGKTVTGISYVGTKEIARKYGGIKMGLPQVNDLGEFFAASIQATDTRNNLTMVGSSVQPKQLKRRTGELVDDRFAYVKAISKAQRNAIRALIPETFLKEMYRQYSSGEYKQPEKPVYRDSVQVVAPSRPDIHNVKAYFEQLGYDVEFQVWDDGDRLRFKPVKFIDHPQYREHVAELGARWDGDKKCYVIQL